ncbi:hypothetical protein ACFX13_000487 [Malus domestica]
MCRNILLTKSNLASKHIANDLLCPLCNSYGESTSHIIRDCHFARCAWLSSSLGYLPQLVGYPSFSKWASELATSLPSAKFELMMVTNWGIWNCRNAMLWNGKCDSPDILASRAVSCW